MAVLAIDFDNTMVSGDQPLEGVKEAINILREQGHKIIIHSCNGTKWIKKVLDSNEIRYDFVCENDGGKPLADLYIDDKGYHFPFNGSWTEELPKIQERIKGKDNRKW
jgi:hydroxymethylpyrimidine pyrophosphatase-like HAD family hydrolase